MKKSFKILLISLSFLLILTSCSNIRKFDSCHPTNQPMSKWEGDAEGLHFELYIGDEDREILIINYGDEKVSYLVWWHQNYLTQMSIVDTYTNKQIAFWDVEIVNKSSFKLVRMSQHYLDEIPENAGALPEEITMKRVKVGLSESEIDPIISNNS